MKRYQRYTWLLWSVLALSGLGLLAGSFCLEPSGNRWAVVLFLGICLLVQILLAWTTQAYLRELVGQLSGLIDQLTQLRDTPVFPPLKDTLLSRLQQQVERLSAIWNKQNAQARQERDEIQALVSDLSHQLKTPVATLHIYGALLADTELSLDQRREYGIRMKRALERLDFLLDSMVKLSRLEMGSIRLQPRPADAEALLLNAAVQIRKAAEEKEISVTIQPFDRPIQVICDKKWTEEAIFNVLDNAVKYTPLGGRVQIRHEVYETYCRINIVDTGCGILPEEIPKVFQRFYRGENARETDGAGLGLSLTRKILQEQGGWIKVNSDDTGCIFSIFLQHT